MPICIELEVKAPTATEWLIAMRATMQERRGLFPVNVAPT